MGRRLNSGRGQSSLGYLFGGGSGGEADNNTQPPPSAEIPSDAATSVEPSQDSPKSSTVTTEESSQKPPESYNVINQNPNAVVHDCMTNNYHRPDGQNCGNYITV